MPTSFSHIDLCLVTLPLPLLQLLQTTTVTFAIDRCYHITLLLNILLQILSFPGVVELTTQLLILENILWLPLCRINKFGLNTLPSKAVAIPYTCGLSVSHNYCLPASSARWCGLVFGLICRFIPSTWWSVWLICLIVFRWYWFKDFVVELR